MREVEKSEGNYMPTERSIGNRDRTEATNTQTKEEKSKKKKCALYYTRGVYATSTTTLL